MYETRQANKNQLQSFQPTKQNFNGAFNSIERN